MHTRISRSGQLIVLQLEGKIIDRMSKAMSLIWENSKKQVAFHAKKKKTEETSSSWRWLVIKQGMIAPKQKIEVGVYYTQEKQKVHIVTITIHLVTTHEICIWLFRSSTIQARRHVKTKLLYHALKNFHVEFVSLPLVTIFNSKFQIWHKRVLLITWCALAFICQIQVTIMRPHPAYCNY